MVAYSSTEQLSVDVAAEMLPPASVPAPASASEFRYDWDYISDVNNINFQNASHMLEFYKCDQKDLDEVNYILQEKDSLAHIEKKGISRDTIYIKCSRGHSVCLTFKSILDKDWNCNICDGHARRGREKYTASNSGSVGRGTKSGTSASTNSNIISTAQLVLKGRNGKFAEENSNINSYNDPLLVCCYAGHTFRTSISRIINKKWCNRCTKESVSRDLEKYNLELKQFYLHIQSINRYGLCKVECLLCHEIMKKVPAEERFNCHLCPELSSEEEPTQTSANSFETGSLNSDERLDEYIHELNQYNIDEYKFQHIGNEIPNKDQSPPAYISENRDVDNYNNIWDETYFWCHEA
jgi:hypothetical protein